MAVGHLRPEDLRDYAHVCSVWQDLIFYMCRLGRKVTSQSLVSHWRLLRVITQGEDDGKFAAREELDLRAWVGSGCEKQWVTGVVSVADHKELWHAVRRGL